MVEQTVSLQLGARRVLFAVLAPAVVAWPSPGHSDPDPTAAKPRVSAIQWPDEGTISVSGSTSSRFTDLEKTLLPVLIPRPFLAQKSLVFVGDRLEYTASVDEGDTKLAVTGTRIAIDVPDDSAAAASIPGQIVTSLREKAAEASFNRYGAAYQVTIECGRKSDSRCNNAAYVTNLVRSMDFVGGGREGVVPAAPRMPTVPSTISVSADPDFRADPPGDLLPNSGAGVHSPIIYAPGIRFPVSVKPVFLNSQVWNVGGTSGPPGGWSDPRNYRYPWRDTFCEKRHWPTPMCPGGYGHQGVDIRPAKPKNQLRQMGVAVENGRISYVGTFKITLAGDSGTHYNYLHMRDVRVVPGQRVTAGQPLGLISNNFGTSTTTYHLHFEVQQNRNGKGWVHVPPYSSLVAAYERL